jgi:hypothetical protein
MCEHLRCEGEREPSISDDGRDFHNGREGSIELVSGLFVHPASGLLCFRPERRRSPRTRRFFEARAELNRFGIEASTTDDVQRYRVQGLRVWERRDSGWFIHDYCYVPHQVARVLTRSDGVEVPIYNPARYACAVTKQASKKEICVAQKLLQLDPLGISRRKAVAGVTG